MTPLGALFYLFAALGLGAAVLTATRRNPVHAVCCAVAVFLSVGALLAVEAVSILLFAALAAVMLLGRGKTGRKTAAGGRAA